MRYYVTVAGRSFEVELSPDETRLDGQPVSAEVARVAATDVRSLLLDGASHRLIARRRGAGGWSLQLGGRGFDVEVLDERTRAIREMTGASAGHAGPRPIRAPMPGLVVKVEVGEGDTVQEGQGVVIVEAMKMENELRAEGPGMVSRVLVSEGEAVEKDQVLIEMIAQEGQGSTP
jgi:biotin carboxyl carrier protein